MSKLMESFNQFFEGYKGVWNSKDSEQMCQVFTKELQVRWEYSGGEVPD